jgi:uncharacterized damage-inducible protein DinB
MFEHNLWANEKLLSFCAGLDDEVLESSLEGHYGTIREMLWHIVRAEVTYHAVLTTPRPEERRLSEHPVPPVNDMLELNSKAGTALIETARTGPADAFVEGERFGEHYRFPATAMFIQAIDHATEHRTQISAILTLKGIEPPSVDGWTYLDEVLDPAGARE